MRFLFLLFLLIPYQAWGTCGVGCTDCRPTDTLQTSFETCLTNAADGAIITLPANTYTWTSTTTKTISNNLIIQGERNDLTFIVANLNGIVLDITKSGSNTLIIRDIAFKGNRITGNKYHNSGILKVSGTGWRLTKLKFSDWYDVWTPSQYDSWALYAQGSGLIDNCTFIPEDKSAGGIQAFGSGATSWQGTITPGGTDMIYIEDNEFTWPDAGGGQADIAVDMYSGAKVVFRYNTVANTTFGGHGLDSGPYRSALYYETYGNSYSAGGIGTFDRVQGSRGGTGLSFYNKWSGTPWHQDGIDRKVKLETFRICADSNHIYGSWGRCASTPWKICSNSANTACETTCTGGTCTKMWLSTAPDTPCNQGEDNCTRYLDGDGTYNYPCRDQIGRGPNQALYPVYIWNVGDTHQGSVGSDCTSPPPQESDDIQADRDYYNYTTSFNGTSGIGCGSALLTPWSCTIGVGYWVTNQSCSNVDSYVGKNPTTPISGTLYKCTSTNTWTPYFTPYGYPFYLRQNLTLGVGGTITTGVGGTISW